MISLLAMVAAATSISLGSSSAPPMQAAAAAATPCTRAGSCHDDFGAHWDLTTLAGTHHIGGPPDPSYSYTYSFSLFDNVALPPICELAHVTAANAARVDAQGEGRNACQALGPDMSITSGVQFTLRRLPSGGGLLFSYSVDVGAGRNTLAVELRCNRAAGDGNPRPMQAGSPGNFYVVWDTARSCESRRCTVQSDCPSHEYCDSVGNCCKYNIVMCDTPFLPAYTGAARNPIPCCMSGLAERTRVCC